MDRLDAVLQEIRAMTVPPEVSVSRHPRRIPKPLRIALPALAVGIGIAMIAFHRPSTGVPPASVVAKPVAEWQQVMERIDAHRMRAFMAGDAAPLALADALHSPAHATDVGILTQLQTRGLRLDHDPTHIDRISEEYLATSGDIQRVGLRVTDHLDAHTYIDTRGTIVESRPARGRRAWTIELRRSTKDGRWRLFSAEPAPQRSAPSSRLGN